MNSIFKRQLRIINLISIFFLLLIFSCNLKSNLTEETVKVQKETSEVLKSEAKEKSDNKKKEEKQEYNVKASKGVWKRREYKGITPIFLKRD